MGGKGLRRKLHGEPAEGMPRKSHGQAEPVAADAKKSRLVPGATCVLDPLYVHERFLTEREAGQLLGLSAKTLQLYRYEGRGPAYVRLGRKRAIRYRLRSLLAWAAKFEVHGET